MLKSLFGWLKFRIDFYMINILFDPNEWKFKVSRRAVRWGDNFIFIS